jgi:hypothetical protein
MKTKLRTKLLIIPILLSVVFSLMPLSKVSAADEYILGEETEATYADSEVIYREFYITDYSPFGVPSVLELDVTYDISYQYDEGIWSYITNLAINIDGLYIDGDPYSYSSEGFEKSSSKGYRTILVNNYTLVEIGISIDEYGEIYTYAKEV